MYKRGFTLIEVLISLAICSVIGMGLYSMFTSVTANKDRSLIQNESILLQETLTRLFNKDARMMTENSVRLDKGGDGVKLRFTSQNSLRFNRAIPVDISYYVDKDSYLIRREESTDVAYDMEMKLLKGVSSIAFTFYNGSKYQEELVRNAKMFNIEIVVNDITINIPIARTIDNQQ